MQPESTSADTLFDEVARMKNREGVILLETQTPLAKGKSVLGFQPLEMVCGNIRTDLDLLRKSFARLKKLGHDTGALVGWISYEGEFVFGAYASLRFANASPKQVQEGQAGQAPEPALKFVPQMSREAFCESVRRAKDFIAAGDIYQVNLSYPWRAHWDTARDFWCFYAQLREKSPAPYSAYLNLRGMEVASSSPECFLQMHGRQIVTRPIKGTRPRGKNIQEDEALAQELSSSSKERAELVMITDLERNDLGQVCEFGSVRVRELLKLEKYAQVQHLVSTVEGTLREDVDHFAALAAAFPGGSITGAPKKRAMEIIDLCELGPRSLYTGALGYFSVSGESQFSIAIRTAWKQGSEVRFDTGAGIVADSDPEKEWEETCHKAAGLLAVRV